MNTAFHPKKWGTYAKLISQSDKEARSRYDEINDVNIEDASADAIGILVVNSIENNIEVDEFAYMIFSLSQKNLSYFFIFGELETSYGKMPRKERERFVDLIANFYYLISFEEVDEEEKEQLLKNAYLPTWERLGIDPE